MHLLKEKTPTKARERCGIEDTTPATRKNAVPLSALSTFCQRSNICASTLTENHMKRGV